jgi:hypothetical protein
MPGTDPGTAREEAERLVATLLAAVRVADIGRWARRDGGFGQQTPRTPPSQPPQGTQRAQRWSAGGRSGGGRSGMARGHPYRA